MNKLLVFAVGMFVGIAATSIAAYIYGGKYLLWGVYMDSVANARKNISILTNLDEGNTEKAKYYLLKYLETDEAILRDCDNNLCSKQIFPEVQETLKEINKYRNSKNYE